MADGSSAQELELELEIIALELEFAEAEELAQLQGELRCIDREITLYVKSPGQSLLLQTVHRLTRHHRYR